jgi:hypothetical protein
MSYFEFGYRLYEFTTISPAGSDDWVIECVELSNPDGFFGSIRIPPDTSEALLHAERGSELPVAVVRHWLTLVAGMQADTAEEPLDDRTSNRREPSDERNGE